MLLLVKLIHFIVFQSLLTAYRKVGMDLKEIKEAATGK